MTRVLVIADTHIPANSSFLSSMVKKEAEKCQCCFHAGDFTEYTVLEELEKLTVVYGVAGNMDDKNIRDRLPEKMIVPVEGVTVGLIHGRGSPAGIIDYVKRSFGEDSLRINIFIFGHSHIACDQEIDGKIYFNPGSVTDTVFTAYRSYGIFEINDTEVKRQIVRI